MNMLSISLKDDWRSMAVLGQKIWGHGPVASKCLPEIEARRAESGNGVIGEGAASRLPTSYGPGGAL